MKLKTITRCAVLNALVAIVISTHAAELKEGDKAPKLSVSKWVQGEPVKGFQPGTAYLVEFWATWWAPCKDAMANLSRLHDKYKDKGLVVIGQNVREKTTAGVEPFVKRMGKLMPYRIALDQGATNRLSGQMQENWLNAAEAGIPTAFLVDKEGKLCFIGHPDAIEEKMIEQVLAGTFDMKARAVEREAAAANADLWETHNQLGKDAWQAKQWDKAMSQVDELDKLFPRKKSVNRCFRITILIGKGDFEAASKMALQLSDDHKDDPFLQNRIVRTIANRAPTNSVILNTANQIIERASALVKDSDILHTQARVAFLQGKKEKAIKLETEAISLAEPETKDLFERALKTVKEGKLPE